MTPVCAWVTYNSTNVVLFTDISSKCTSIVIDGDWVFAELRPESTDWQVQESTMYFSRRRFAVDLIRSQVVVSMGETLFPIRPLPFLDEFTRCNAIVPMHVTSSIWRYWRYASGSVDRWILTNNPDDVHWPMADSPHELRDFHWITTDSYRIDVDVNWRYHTTLVPRHVRDKYVLPNGDIILPITAPYHRTIHLNAWEYRCGIGFGSNQSLVIGISSLWRFQWLIDSHRPGVYLYPIHVDSQEGPSRSYLVPPIIYAIIMIDVLLCGCWILYKSGAQNIWIDPSTSRTHPYVSSVFNAPYGMHHRGFVALGNRGKMAVTLAVGLTSVTHCVIACVLVVHYKFAERMCQAGGICVLTADLGLLIAFIYTLLLTAITKGLVTMWLRTSVNDQMHHVEYLYLSNELIVYLTLVLLAFPWDNRSIVHVQWNIITILGALLIGTEVLKILVHNGDMKSLFERIIIVSVYALILITVSALVGVTSGQRFSQSLIDPGIAFWSYLLGVLVLPTGFIYVLQIWFELVIFKIQLSTRKVI